MLMPELYADVIGQDRAVAQLHAAIRHNVHAYLFVGPSGVGKRAATRSFAASLLCPDMGCGKCDVCIRVLNERHPDFVVVERKGAAISLEQAREIVRVAFRTPLEGDRQVILLTDFHLVEEAAPALLKTIEEPSPATIFVIHAEHVPNELLTIASRCVRVEFSPLMAGDIVDVLVSEEVDVNTATTAASAANGSLTRARLLTSDPHVADRRDLWLSIPTRLNKTGAVVAQLAKEISESLDSVIEPLQNQQQMEMDAYLLQSKEIGDRITARKEIDDRHRREQRRMRTDELRFGMNTLAAHYRDQLLLTGADHESLFAALDSIHAANEELIRNPNETLLLEALLLSLEQTVAV